ncbi:hypothetical protein [Nocardioides jiangxiensis]|uniref:Secreted protein n=1 Tax=Nocardioides jiangxiensis TaxID=3064524 RepID=A0ABT9B7A2_9ACTN|nr:hypothetical protein [Nocardioides sp. WY-20]MDO7869176.1 hypothetical protein [Nocardioides sp. WY-20]
MAVLLIVAALLVCAVPAAAVLLYVAHQQHGHTFPQPLQRVGNVLVQGRERLPVLTEEDGDRVAASRR